MSDPVASPAEQATPSAELVREVAEKVYRLWLRDLRIQQERSRPAGPAQRRRR